MSKPRDLPKFLREQLLWPAWKSRELRLPRLSRIDGMPVPMMGPGGSSCPCCCAAPGSVGRKKAVKAIRRRVRREALAEGWDDLHGL